MSLKKQGSSVWVVSELYYPETTSTGYFLTGIAEGIAQHYPVGVLCSQPTYSARGTVAPSEEVRNDVRIFRCAGTTLNKDVLAFRLLNGLTMTASIFTAAVSRFRRGDRVLVVTNPPFLPYAIRMACGMRGARCVLLVHDVYPESAIAAGLTTETSLVSRLVGWMSRRLYRAMDRIVVLGRDMRQVIQKRMGDASVPIDVIPNWGSVDEVMPADRRENRLLKELGISDKFVITYSGNMGRTHGLEVLVEAARRLEKQDVHFVLIGWGAKRSWVEEQARSVSNVTVLSPRPYSELADSLNACDLAVISFIPGMAGVSVPSRMYNVLAAGKPLLAIADRDSELAMVVEEERAGWVVPPNDVEAVVSAIQYAQAHPDELRLFGENARRAAVSKYSERHVVEAFTEVMALDTSVSESEPART